MCPHISGIVEEPQKGSAIANRGIPQDTGLAEILRCHAVIVDPLASKRLGVELAERLEILLPLCHECGWNHDHDRPDGRVCRKAQRMQAKKEKTENGIAGS
jgi:hypothetical protein